MNLSSVYACEVLDKKYRIFYTHAASFQSNVAVNQKALNLFTVWMSIITQKTATSALLFFFI